MREMQLRETVSSFFSDNFSSVFPIRSERPIDRFPGWTFSRVTIFIRYCLCKKKEWRSSSITNKDARALSLGRGTRILYYATRSRMFLTVVIEVCLLIFREWHKLSENDTGRSSYLTLPKFLYPDEEESSWHLLTLSKEMKFLKNLTRIIPIIFILTKEAELLICENDERRLYSFHVRFTVLNK